MQCPACGVEVVQQAIYCHKCGHRVLEENEGQAQSARQVNDGTAPTEAFARAASARLDNSDPPEQELWRGGFSSKAMIGAWFTSGAISLILLIVGVTFARTAAWWLVLLALAILPWLYYLCVLYYRRLSFSYVLTNQRFVHESGILRRVNDRIEVLDMDDVSFEQGLLERLVGVGTIRIISTDRSHPDFLLPGIENVAAVAQLFDNARMAERRRRGLHVENI